MKRLLKAISFDKKSGCDGGLFPRKRVFSFYILGLSFLLVACAVPPPAPTPAIVSSLNTAPQLARFNRFDLVSQAVGTAPEQKISGALNFQGSGATFDVRTAGDPNVGRLLVQPETCRDDPSEDCARRFVISGRLDVFGTSVNCYIGVRNDTAVGYLSQSLTGICRDRYSRSFAITLFSN